MAFFIRKSIKEAWVDWRRRKDNNYVRHFFDELCSAMFRFRLDRARFAASRDLIVYVYTCFCGILLNNLYIFFARHEKLTCSCLIFYILHDIEEFVLRNHWKIKTFKKIHYLCSFMYSFVKKQFYFESKSNFIETITS